MPVTAFLRADQLAKDVAQVNDAARGKTRCRLPAWHWR